jgi:predicted lipoprotein with Yx(FWY)xxD motif
VRRAATAISPGTRGRGAQIILRLLLSVNRISALLASMLLALLAATASAGATDASPSARTTLFHTVEVRKTKLGEVLVNSAGSLLFEFTRDHPKKDSCVKISGCSAVWTPLPVAGRPSGGSGVHAGLLSSIKLPEGISQVTYAGHPLYIYTPAPKSTSYVEVKQFGGSWLALNRAGGSVR